MPCDHSSCLFLSKLSKYSIIFWLSLNGGKGVSCNSCNFGQKYSKKGHKIQGFLTFIWLVFAKTTEIMSKNPQIVRNGKTPCPQFNDNQYIIDYLDSLDEDKQNEWSQGISTGNSCGDIEDFNNFI